MSEPVKIDWRQRYQATREKVARLRAEVNLEETPQYRVAVKETAKAVTLSRDVYSVTFDKKSAMVRSAVLDGVKLGGVMLPHLLIIDETGKALKQSESTAGDLKVRHEKFSLFLEGYFTIAGKRVPIVYEMDRMTGTTFCTMDVPGPLKVRRMTLEHGLGKTPRPLDTFYAPHHYLKTFQPYKPVVINEYKIDIIFEKDTVQLWTDGHIGLQVFSMTWDKSKVLPAEKKYIYGTGEIRNGSSWVDLTFFSTGTAETIDLPDGYKVTCAFSPMPFKKWLPTSDIFGSMYLVPSGDEAKLRERTETVVNHFGRCGTTLACHGETHGCNDPVNPAYTKWFQEAAYRNGVRIILYIERSLANIKRHPQAGLLTAQELLDGRQELVSHFGADNNGSPQWGDSSPMCSNYEPWRIHILTMCDYHLDEMGFHGIYLDSSFVCSCHNTRHGESPDESTSVRGSMIFQQDLRLIMDDYKKRTGRDYPLINHYWDQHVAPVAGVSDYTMPGEQDAYKIHKFMTIENKRYGYSALPCGVNFIWYSSWTYDYTSPQIYNDAADCGAIIWISPYNDNIGQYNPLGIFKHQTHVQPLVQYNLRGTRPVHRYLPEYTKLFTGGDKTTRCTMYFKDNSFLLYLVNDGPKSAKTSFSVKLPKAWKNVLVIDGATCRFVYAKAKAGKLEMKGLDCSGGPLPIVIMPEPQGPALVWYDHVCRDIKATVGGDKIVIEGRGVARASAAMFVHMPADKALGVGGSALGPKTWVVPVVFDADGTMRLQVEIVPAPKTRQVWERLPQ